MAGGNYVSPTAELYDPASGTWTVTGEMSQGRAYHTATLLPDGRVLVAGGMSGNETLASAELYDPSLGTWSSAGSMGVVREGHTATLLADGTVLVVGGAGDLPEQAALSTAELYDPSTGTWTATANMDDARIHQTATLMPDGTVLVTGGYISGPAGTLLDSAELYVPGSGN